MLNQNHPDDERLSALASHDVDATADAVLTAHVSKCDRCTALVGELGALRLALADLPDLRPSRPLQLLPPAEVAEPVAADRIGGWARRFFAPVLASGAALALVGVIGTAAPALDGMASGPEASADVAQQEAAEGGDSAAAPAGALDESAASVSSLDGAVSGEGDQEAAVPSGADLRAPASSERATTALADEADDAAAPLSPVTPERSPWPMVLFAGVALIVAAVLMRWMLAPKSG